MPLVIGNCSHLANAMAYDVPGGGAEGSNHVDQSTWTAPFSGRLLAAVSHQHGGGKYQLLESRTCGRRLFKAPVYHGPPGHPYNTIRPILHEPGPIGNGSYVTADGIPVVEGEVLRRVAVHDNHNLHVASMGFWIAVFVPDASVERCGPMPDDIVEINRPRRFDRTPNHDLVVPQLARPGGAFRPFDGDPLDDRRQLLPAAEGDGRRRADRHVDVRRHAAAHGHRRERPARVLLDLPGTDPRQLQRHAAGARHVQAHVPDPPYEHGADARGEVTAPVLSRSVTAVAAASAAASTKPSSKPATCAPGAAAQRVGARRRQRHDDCEAEHGPELGAGGQQAGREPLVGAVERRGAARGRGDRGHAEARAEQHEAAEQRRQRGPAGRDREQRQRARGDGRAARRPWRGARPPPPPPAARRASRRPRRG